jgi:hypothetical protein
VGRNGRIIALLPVPTETIDDVSVILNWRSVAENERRRSQKAVPPKF